MFIVSVPQDKNKPLGRQELCCMSAQEARARSWKLKLVDRPETGFSRSGHAWDPPAFCLDGIFGQLYYYHTDDVGCGTYYISNRIRFLLGRNGNMRELIVDFHPISMCLYPVLEHCKMIFFAYGVRWGCGVISRHHHSSMALQWTNITK